MAPIDSTQQIYITTVAAYSDTITSSVRFGYKVRKILLLFGSVENP